jgi:deoxyadenosine/deoxycytidine kinase
MELWGTSVLYTVPVHEKVEILIRNRNFEAGNISSLNAILEEALSRYQSMMQRTNISHAVALAGSHKIDSADWATLRHSVGGGE